MLGTCPPCFSPGLQGFCSDTWSLPWGRSRVQAALRSASLAWGCRCHPDVAPPSDLRLALPSQPFCLVHARRVWPRLTSEADLLLPALNPMWVPNSVAESKPGLGGGGQGDEKQGHPGVLASSTPREGGVGGQCWVVAGESSRAQGLM